MSSWQEFEADAPALAAAARARFTAARHHVLATIRADGAPRVSGTEVDFWHDDAWLGSMLGAVKSRDLLRDPRCAIHANPGDGSMAGGDAKLTATAIEAADALVRAYAAERHAPEPFHLFALDVTEVVLTWLGGDDLIIATWRPGAGVTGHARPTTAPPRRLAPDDPLLTPPTPPPPPS